MLGNKAWSDIALVQSSHPFSDAVRSIPKQNLRDVFVDMVGCISHITESIAFFCSVTSVGSEKTIPKRKHRNRIFTGWSHDLLGILFMCFVPPPGGKTPIKDINTFWHPPSPGTIP